MSSGTTPPYCVDDGIEIDYNQSNARVWRNRVTNARMGVSVQPIRGGPAYIFRNELFNLESVPVKMHNYTTGFIVAHNTAVKHGDGHGDNGAMWRNATFRNNLFLGTRYAFEFTTVADEGFGISTTAAGARPGPTGERRRRTLNGTTCATTASLIFPPGSRTMESP